MSGSASKFTKFLKKGKSVGVKASAATALEATTAGDVDAAAELLAQLKKKESVAEWGGDDSEDEQLPQPSATPSHFAALVESATVRKPKGWQAPADRSSKSPSTGKGANESSADNNISSSAPVAGGGGTAAPAAAASSSTAPTTAAVVVATGADANPAADADAAASDGVDGKKESASEVDKKENAAAAIAAQKPAAPVVAAHKDVVTLEPLILGRARHMARRQPVGLDVKSKQQFPELGAALGGQAAATPKPSPWGKPAGQVGVPATSVKLAGAKDTTSAGSSSSSSGLAAARAKEEADKAAALAAEARNDGSGEGTSDDDEDDDVGAEDSSDIVTLEYLLSAIKPVPCAFTANGELAAAKYERRPDFKV